MKLLPAHILPTVTTLPARTEAFGAAAMALVGEHTLSEDPCLVPRSDPDSSLLPVQLGGR